MRISGKRIAILGFAFKKDTNDTRESAAIYVCRDLLAENAHLAIVDPQVEPDAVFRDLGRVTGKSRSELEAQVCCERDAYRATDGAHAIAALTEWDEFASLDFERIYARMQKPAFVFDGRNILPRGELRRIGFDVCGIGKFEGTPRSADGALPHTKDGHGPRTATSEQVSGARP
jgi:UDPglucose 6-dehydrogenase